MLVEETSRGAWERLLLVGWQLILALNVFSLVLVSFFISYQRLYEALLVKVHHCVVLMPVVAILIG